MRFSIPEGELVFRATRAGGPGGQHVNKASTRMEVLWDFERTRLLTEAERDRVRQKLARRLDADGMLMVAADERRSQLQNRIAAIERLEALVDAAKRAPKPRKPTRPTAASRQRRLEAKKRRAGVKKERKPLWDD
jgi:ribosome-associated protein